MGKEHMWLYRSVSAAQYCEFHILLALLSSGVTFVGATVQ